jgi:hypothetical protein
MVVGKSGMTAERRQHAGLACARNHWHPEAIVTRQRSALGWGTAAVVESREIDGVRLFDVDCDPSVKPSVIYILSDARDSASHCALIIRGVRGSRRQVLAIWSRSRPRFPR